MNETKEVTTDFKIRKGDQIFSVSNGWTRKIHKMKHVEEEVILRNLEDSDERTYTLLLENVMKGLQRGLYKLTPKNAKTTDTTVVIGE